jgi:hypothetical protein
MDFRVTHFLVAASAQTDGVTSTLQALANGRIACYPATATSSTAAVVTNQTVPFYFAQGLDSTDAIQKELGVIKSGVINPSKVVSVRKLVGSDDYSRQAKVFGAAASMLSYNGAGTVFPTSNTVTIDTFYYISTGSHLFYCIFASGNTAASTPTTTSLVVGEIVASGSNLFIYLGTTYVAGTTATSNRIRVGLPTSTGVGTLEFESDKEYTFSVRVRSAQANNISPFGITRGYSALASKTFINTATGASSVSNGYTPFSTLFGLVKNFADDTMLASFANVTAVMYYCGSADGTVTDIIYFKNGNILNADSTYVGISTNFTTNVPSHLLVAGNAASAREAIIDVTKYTTWHEALTAAEAVVDGLMGTHQTTVVPGETYTASLIVDAKEQINYNLSYASGVTDPTVFPYKWDIVRLNGFFHEGPYGKNYDWYSTGVINAGVSTQTPIVFDQTQSGLISPFTIAINAINFTDDAGTPVASTQVAGFAVGKYISGATNAKLFSIENQVKFPNLLKEEVRHIAHQYQSYSLKYKQQFRNPRFNAMVMDPFQSKIDAAGPYTLYYIEYMPEVDTAYTSTQPMTNLTILAVPSASTDLITDLDAILTGEVTESAS